MEIKSVSLYDLRKMNNSEGLILQGCGGDLQEWVDGINETLTKNGILQNESRFEKAYTFNNEDLTCLLFPFDDIQLDVGKLAMWRLETRETFGGIWLLDYVENKLNGFINEQTKPKCALIGQNGNIFAVMGIASRILKKNGMADQAKEMCSRITSSHSYEEALSVICEYVEPVSVEDYEEDNSLEYDESEDFEMELT